MNLRGKVNIIATTCCDSSYTGFRPSDTVGPNVCRGAAGESAGSPSPVWSWTGLLFQKRIGKGKHMGMWW